MDGYPSDLYQHRQPMYHVRLRRDLKFSRTKTQQGREKKERKWAGFHENRSWCSRLVGYTNAIELQFAAEPRSLFHPFFF